MGYVMLEGYDLPPLNFGSDEVEAIVGDLSLLSRTGDKGLQVAAQKVLSKIDTQRLATDALSVSNWGIEDASNALATKLRESIRNEQKISIRYTGLDASTTQRTVLPLSITYYIKVAVLEAWCKLREDFRHFRVDRIEQCDPLSANFSGGGQRLRKELLEADDQNSKEM